MILATIKSGTPIHSYADARNGRLVVINTDRTQAALVPEDTYPSLLEAFDDWNNAENYLREYAQKLEYKEISETMPVSQLTFMAPLPRTWAFLDGSAFIHHIVLVRRARGAEPPENMLTVPLMYQGINDTLLGPTDNIPLLDYAHGLDFEGEVAVIVDQVPCGTTAANALSHVKLLVLLNDWSLRNLIPQELAGGFGFLQSKPSSSFSPFAITPEELGSAWREGRVHLPLECNLNGTLQGKPDAGQMHFSFAELIAHAAKTRTLSAGTIIGSGTISNDSDTVGVACLAERRMREKISNGEMLTPFLKEGDRVCIDMKQNGKSIFGKLDQRVVGVT